jgi:hypothetical protein
MKIQVTVLSLEKLTSAKGNDYGNAQVIFHDDKVTAGPCRIFGELFQELHKDFKANSRYVADITLQPDANGTRVMIDALTPVNAAKAQPVAAAA